MRLLHPRAKEVRPIDLGRRSCESRRVVDSPGLGCAGARRRAAAERRLIRTRGLRRLPLARGRRHGPGRREFLGGTEHAIAPGLAFAFRRLDRADVRIAKIACEIGMSRERFSKAFCREFGLTPKTFARATLRPRSTRAAARAFSRRSGAGGRVRLRRSGAYDPRFPGIRRQPAVRAPQSRRSPRA